MLDELRLSDTMTRDMRQHLNEIRAATHRLEAELGRAPDDEQLATALGLSLEQYHGLQSRLGGHSVCSLSDFGTDVAQPPADEHDNPCQAASDAELRRILAEAIAALPEREQTVLRQYYFEELTLKQIAERLGVTESRICQIHTQATRKLRQSLIHLVTDAE